MPRAFNIVGRVALTLVLLSGPAMAVDETNAIAARDRALAADADTLAAKAYESAQDDLERAQKLDERGRDPGRVAAAFREASDGFDRAELEAIGNTLFADARAAIRDADRARAKRYAPVTLQRARDLLNEAEQALAEDRASRELPAQLAGQARRTARHAADIAELARSKPDLEALVLQWESYLREAQELAGVNSPEDATPAELAEQLNNAVAELAEDEQRMRKDLADSRAYNAALEGEIRELDARLGGAKAERQELVMQLESQARTEEQFQQTEALFEPWEADVFRQSGNVVIRLVALQFDSGSAQLDPGNADLLAKVGKAIDIYPDSSIRVEGHTDSQGSARLNQRLSQNRADAVLDYLVETMRVSPTRMGAVGYGSERPVASNETKEGRAKNRRIDLVISP